MSYSNLDRHQFIKLNAAALTGSVLLPAFLKEQNSNKKTNSVVLREFIPRLQIKKVERVPSHQ